MELQFDSDTEETGCDRGYNANTQSFDQTEMKRNFAELDEFDFAGFETASGRASATATAAAIAGRKNRLRGVGYSAGAQKSIELEVGREVAAGPEAGTATPAGKLVVGLAEGLVDSLIETLELWCYVGVVGTVRSPVCDLRDA